MKRKKIVGIVIGFCLLNMPLMKVYAAQPNFSFYPSSGIVENIEEGFTVDILIESGGYNISKARAVVKFNPKVIQLRKAMRNNSLFDQWPETESTTDNGNGIVMLTGYTPLGGSSFYKTGTEPDVFARLEFDVIDTQAKEVVLSFEFNGKEELFQSFLINANSPYQNVLISKPLSATFVLESPATPSTSIDRSSLGMIVGVFLILIGGFVRGSRVDIGKKRGTIVLEDD